MTQLELFVAGLVFQAAYDATSRLIWLPDRHRAVFRAPPIRGNSLAFDWIVATREHHWLRGLTPRPASRDWVCSTP